MRVARYFTNVTQFHTRINNSLVKYKPDNIRLVEQNPDLIIGHYGLTTNQQFWQYINTPKVIFLEFFNNKIAKCFTDRDIAFTYSDSLYHEIATAGINVQKLPFPVDSDIFYIMDLPNIFDICTIGVHTDYPLIVSKICEKNHFRHLVLTMNKEQITNNIYGRTMYDYTYDTDKLRQYLNLSKYVMSIHPDTGFEMGLAEGLLCGCMPIVPNTYHWGNLYKDNAIKVDMDNFEDCLKNILDTGISCSFENIERFNAELVWRKFWERVSDV